jgi:hypothetical protein
VRFFLISLAYLAALMLVAPAAFGVVILLAGPHSGILPAWSEPVVMGLGWLAVLVLPLLLTRKVWRRMNSDEQPHGSP